MSSEIYVRIVKAENLRFPGAGSSTQGKPGAKARPKGVVDAHTVEIPWPLQLKYTDTKAELDPGVGCPGPEKGTEIQVRKQVKPAARKGICMEEAPVPQTDTGR